MEIEIFKTQLKQLGEKVESLKNNLETEEATKMALVTPFFSLLGYDIFNPNEFVPEFTADVGIKKGEKVDYAIVKSGKPLILIEVKSITNKLDNHCSQLFRYFGTTAASFGILTNGREYRFFTDLDAANKMDSLPFLSFDITNLSDTIIYEIYKFSKENFDANDIRVTANELKYLSAIKSFFDTQFKQPDENFLRYVVGEVYEGKKTQSVLDNFTPIVAKGFNQFINERVNQKLTNALKANDEPKEPSKQEEAEEEVAATENNGEIVTTPTELEVYTLVKFMLSPIVDSKRVYYRDNRSYFNVLLDDKITKWILRFYQSNSNMFFILNDDDKTRYDIDSTMDLSNYKNKIIEVAKKHI